MSNTNVDKNSIDLNSKILHHANLYEGDRDMLIRDLRGFFVKKLGVRVRGNPDYSEEQFDTFTIGDARRLSERSMFKPVTGDQKFFLLALHNITHEAQNALLKLFEEPSSSTYFFLIMPNAAVLLPTLRSRLNLIKRRTFREEKAVAGSLDFLKLGRAGRLSLVKRLADSVLKEEKTRDDVISFLSSIEREAARVLRNGKRSDVSNFLEELIRAKRDFYSRAPSVKILLEHIALFF